MSQELNNYQFFHASVAVGVSAVQLSTTNQEIRRGITVKAANSNTGIVYVGKSSAVTANTAAATDGFELSAGESVTLEIDNLNEVYAIASAASQKVFYVAN